MSVSLYRKYRPQTFDDVVGQEHIEQTLRNAVAKGTVSHAYLFTGPRGTGKTTTARLLAKALLCEKGPTSDPCGTCEQCSEVAVGTHPDVYELDAASRTGVENVREEIIGRVQFAPTRGSYKVYIIDEVHMLSLAAFNALLKTLEEPPDHVVFILCTTDPQKVPETIHSRCQEFDFHRLPIDQIIENLRYICDSEGFVFDEASLELIAKHSAGGMRDAITTLEQLAVFTRGVITFADAEGLLGEVESTELDEIAHLIAIRDVAGCFRWVANFVENGTDLVQFSHSLTAYIRDLYVTELTGGTAGIENATPDEIAHLVELADAFGGPDRLSRMLLLLSELNADLKTSTDPRLSLEIAFTRMARPDSDITLSALAERVEALERGRETIHHKTAPSSVSPVVPEPELRPIEEDGSLPESLSEPQPVPSAKQQSTSSELDASAAQRIWALAAEDIKKKRRSLSGTIATARALLDGDTLVIELPYGSTFSKRVVEEPENHSLIKECLETAAGRGVRFMFTVSQAQPAGSSTMMPRVASVDIPPSDTGRERADYHEGSAIDDDMPPLDDYASVPSEDVSPAELAKTPKDDLAQMLSLSFGGAVTLTPEDDENDID
jgi:DNA polymerase III subunit gamma/tau